jgi:hypothetical protein
MTDPRPDDVEDDDPFDDEGNDVLPDEDDVEPDPQEGDAT